jgi:anthranilate 1,2-dioxygenase small subunit
MSSIDVREPTDLYHRFAIEDLYRDYIEVVTSQNLNDWPAFFTEDCEYRITSQENIERDMPIDLVYCDGRPMIADRAYSIMNLQVYQPRQIRYFLSGLRIVERVADETHTRADYLVVESLLNESPRVVTFGEYRDVVVDTPGGLKFKKRMCIYANGVITTSLVFPL